MTRDHFSADVAAELLLDGGRRIPLAKLGPGYVVPQMPTDVKSGHALLILTVDGSKSVWDIGLISGGECITFEVNQEPTVDC